MTEHNLDFLPTMRERCSYRWRRILMRVAALPGMGPLARFLQGTGTQIENFRRLAEQQKSLFDAQGATVEKVPQSAGDFESGFGYEDEFTELRAAAYYRAQIMAGNLEAQKTESGALYAHVIKILSEVLSREDIKTVLNFGVSYAHIDTQLAKAFPNIQFIGLERSRLTTIYNENIFGPVPNLRFVASDVFEHLKASDYANGLFLHIRTLTLLPENFVTQLYAAANKAGFSHIAGFEQCGISYETDAPYAFDPERDKTSINFRSSMFIHNYPGKAAQQGYRMMCSDLLKTNHPDPTYRIASFVSKKA